MHKNIEAIKKNESSPRIINNIFGSIEIEKFLELYHRLPTTVHNKKPQLRLIE